jgi:hypothetical protein
MSIPDLVSQINPWVVTPCPHCAPTPANSGALGQRQVSGMTQNGPCGGGSIEPHNP